jgi:hypothetical protein
MENFLATGMSEQEIHCALEMNIECQYREQTVYHYEILPEQEQ